MKNPNQFLKMIQTPKAIIAFRKPLNTYDLKQFILLDLENEYLKRKSNESFKHILNKKEYKFAFTQYDIDHYIEQYFSESLQK